VVSDDTFNALTVACHSAGLARQIGIPRVCLVVNRSREGTADKLARFQAETGLNLAERFDGTVMLPAEPLLEKLEPAVTRIMDMQDSKYAAVVSMIASRLIAPDCCCSAASK
jgi:CO dehydrogenase maturation factor